jgi:hypothetical protein
MFRKLDSLSSSSVSGGKDLTQLMPLEGGGLYQVGTFTNAELLIVHLNILYY